MASARDNDELLPKLLCKYMSERMARTVIDDARRSTGTDNDVQPTNVSAFFFAIERQAATLLDRRAQARLRGELEFELATGTSGVLTIAPVADVPVEVRSEWDVSIARGRARKLMTALGAQSYDVVRAMTLVSELARNIVLYAPGGRMAFTSTSAPRSLVVEASDEGPGIPNLNEVLSGRFRSKTGLGKGLIGVRRLATRFAIHTNSRGTHIEAELRF